jgi:hypothetical protein
MARTLRIPKVLSRGPFTLDEARRAGLRRWHLDSTAWRRLGPRTYVSFRTTETPLLLLQAAARRIPPGGAFSGMTSAWLHGLDVAPCDPIEMTVPKSAGVASRAGMTVHRADITTDEVVRRHGLPVTPVGRTVREACSRLSLTEAVVLCDMALHANLLSLAALRAEASAGRGARGVATFRAALDHVEPATESPMETRLRMLLVLAGLPRPEAQPVIRDRWQRLIGRLDLYYREAQLALEYDGGVHREKLAEDNRRQNRLLDAGVRVLRFTAADIYNTPDVVISQVRGALSARVHAVA